MEGRTRSRLSGSKYLSSTLSLITSQSANLSDIEKSKRGPSRFQSQTFLKYLSGKTHPVPVRPVHRIVRIAVIGHVDRRCGRGDYPGIGLGLGRGTRANPCRVEQRHAPADDSTGDAPYNARLEPAAVTSSQSAVTRSQKLLSGPAAKAGRFLFEREPKTYEH